MADFTQKYNTKLSPEEERKFQAWLKENGRERDLADYDMRGAFKEGVAQSENGHFPDTYKKPNHPTFSKESQYNGKDGYVGGEWGGDDENPTFTPSASNLQNMSRQELQEYFNKVEPGVKLILPAPKSRAVDRYATEEMGAQ